MPAAEESQAPSVFISYSWDSPEHRETVCKFANRLRDEGLDCEIDQFCKVDQLSGAPTHGWRAWMRSQVHGANYVLMICTETYHGRVVRPDDEPRGVGRGVMWEADIIEGLIYDKSEHLSRLFPVVFEEDHRRYVPDEWKKRLTSFCVQTDEGHDGLVSRLLPYGPRERLPRRHRNSDRFSLWNVPYEPHGRFADPDDVLRIIYDIFHAEDTLSPTAVIHGESGVGKTCVAVQYADAQFRKKKYRAVFWLHAESEASIQHGFVEIAKTLRLPECNDDDHNLAIAAAKQWLEDEDKWLLVFDAVEDPELVRNNAPKEQKGHVLVTSRQGAHEFVDNGHSVTLGRLNLDGAVEFLRRARNDGKLGRINKAEREAATTLAEELNGLPMALHQAGAFMAENDLSFAAFLELFGRRKSEMFDQEQ